MRGPARTVVVAAAALAAVLLPASPAHAHGVAGAQPTNYATEVHAVQPPVAGVRVRAVDLGEQLELVNTGARTVTVLGYEGEPYLRVGPGGVERNRRSPAVFLNRSSSVPEAAVPPGYDAAAPPEWERVSSGSTARWHDHRAHWMGRADPPAVQDDPGARHVVVEGFEVPLVLDDGTTAVVTGDVVWEPGPSPWPWLALAAGLGLVVVLAGLTRWWPLALGAGLGALAVAEVVHVVGLWGATTSSTVTKLLAGVYSEVAVLLVLGALVLLARRGGEEAAPAALIAALFVAIAGGLADVAVLFRSQVPTTLPYGVARTAVAVALGVGVGTTVAAGLRLRRAPRRAGGRRPAVAAAAAVPGAPPP